MRRFPRLFILLFFVAQASIAAESVPERAAIYLPALKGQITEVWPTAPIPASFAGQVEQETCPSMTHRKCWNPRAELKTSREYGVGCGQITVAYNSDGSVRFNNFEEVKKLDAKLKSWKWEDRYDPARQLRALVLMDKTAFVRLSFAADTYERTAFTLSAYNGGLGGVMQDRRLAKTNGADPNRWFNHVELHSYKSKTKPHGYGQSFYEINRGYVRKILKIRMQKYQPFFD